ncbi:uncharacterized protein B0T23DRAFT_452950, partial [Neurospora hispaniola]
TGGDRKKVGGFIPVTNLPHCNLFFFFSFFFFFLSLPILYKAGWRPLSDGSIHNPGLVREISKRLNNK